MFEKKIIYLSFLLLLGTVPLFQTSCNQSVTRENKAREKFLDDLKQKTFMFFWDRSDKVTFQTDDRYPTPRFTSIASTGFGLTSYIIGIENGYISREEGATQVLSTLDWLWMSKQGDAASGTTGYRGFYYHFLEYLTGERYKTVELSTIDTGLLMAGVLSCQSWFNGNDPKEARIRELADSLYLRVEWDWAMNGQEWMSMGWHPEKGFIKAKWNGYNEAMILVLLGLGSPTHPIPDTAWNSWCKGYQWEDFYGYEHVNFSPLFGHQYSHMYIDFREIVDPYMAKKGIDYFENSRRATHASRAYAMDNPRNFTNYGPDEWGLTACDGPGYDRQVHQGDTMSFQAYAARGASALHIVDDGTIAPTAAGGSIPFAPEQCIDALMHMKAKYGNKLYQEYGFKDAYNMTYVKEDGTVGWFDLDYIGIDQGAILLQIENYQTELVWDLMKKNKYILSGLKKAGFTGGWLNEI
ncbi:MAG: glucoamylase family protein [Bacteroidales bacterium]